MDGFSDFIFGFIFGFDFEGGFRRRGWLYGGGRLVFERCSWVDCRRKVQP